MIVKGDVPLTEGWTFGNDYFQIEMQCLWLLIFQFSTTCVYNQCLVHINLLLFYTWQT